MRCTPEVIHNALVFLNTNKDREIELRGHKFPAIENMGSVPKEVECIMLNDNLISVFGNFPLMPKVKDIEISHNRITRIEPNMHLHLPSLTDLNLDHNRIAELSELDNLAGFTKLKCLVFKYNPICENEHHRLWVAFRTPSVSRLNYDKVKAAERAKSKELFGTNEAPTALALKVINVSLLKMFVDATAGSYISSSELSSFTYKMVSLGDEALKDTYTALKDFQTCNTVKASWLMAVEQRNAMEQGEAISLGFSISERLTSSAARAAKQISSVKTAAEYAADIEQHTVKTTERAPDTHKAGRIKLDEAERAKVVELIKGTKNLDEIARLERILNQGKLPSELLG